MQKTVDGLASRLRGKPSNALRDRALQAFAAGPQLSLLRHAVVCEIRNLLAFFPKELLSRNMDAYDPLPPDSTTTRYDDAYFGPLSRMLGADPTRTARQNQRAFLERLIRQAGVQNPEELLAQMAEQLAEPELPLAQQHEVMPGAFDEDNEDSSDEGEDVRPVQAAGGSASGGQPAPEAVSGRSISLSPDDSSAARQAPAPAGGILQTFWNNLWGRGATVESDEDPGT